MKNTLPYLLFLLIFLFLATCAPKDTVTSRAYHNMTAHFNGYYYAREEVLGIEETIRKSHVDDYNRILRIFPLFDSTLAKTYEKEIQETIKMASLAIQHHPNSKWVDDAYILVGKARLYSLDWGNAIQTFKYINNPKLTKNKDARHKALIVLIRTFTEHKEYNNAQAAIDYLEKQELNKENKKDFALEKALFYQIQGDYDKMVRNLAEADPYLTKKDRKGRIYFIIGQVYQKLGFESEAYNYYKKCLATNPEYEVDFYARLYLAQVTEISRSRNVTAARKSFKKLLKDRKNKDFQDKIYYEMGMFELKQKNLRQAIEDFNLSIRTGSNSRIDGESYLRLGIVYYDTLKDYKKSQAYYDSAISVLPKDYDNYAKIKARQEILNEFVKHLQTIHWQDSLLGLAALDSVALRARVETTVTEKKKREELAAAAQKKKKNRVAIDARRSAFGSEGEEAPSIATEGEGTDWYFGNTSAMSIGQNEFKRVWGDVALEDNWRRSMRGDAKKEKDTPENTEGQEPGDAKPAAEAKVEDPVAAEYALLDKQIPHTEEQRAEALKKIEDAYFALGDIYYFKLEEPDNAIDTYNTLLKRFPETEYEPEVLYKLYLMSKDKPEEAARYAGILKEKHPNSTFARILANPDYLKESGEAAEKQKKLYRVAYDNFQIGNYAEARTVIADAEALGETAFKPRLDLLKILITGETDDISRYQLELEEYAKTYPDGELTPYAKNLLASSRQFTLNQEKSQGIAFVKSFEEPHYFILVYEKSTKLSEPATADLEKFNTQYFKDLKLRTSNLILDDQHALTMVTQLPDLATAMDYRRTFTEKLNTLNGIRNQKFNSFVITKDNFNIFYRTKGLDEYSQFFEKNYPAKNP